MASDFQRFEEMLTRLCEQHGFTSISVGMNTAQREAARFNASLHYSDPLDGLGCSQGMGATIAQALNNANREAVKNRPEPHALVREAA